MGRNLHCVTVLKIAKPELKKTNLPPEEERALAKFGSCQIKMRTMLEVTALIWQVIVL